MNNLPLPAFNLMMLDAKLQNYDSTIYKNLLEQQQTSASIAPAPAIMQVSSGGVLPPPPTKKHVRSMSGTIQVFKI